VPVDKIMTEWPAPRCDLPEPWQRRWKALKHLVRAYNIRHSHPLGDIVNGDTAVEPQDFLKCDGAQGPKWEWLREVCEWWVTANGVVGVCTGKPAAAPQGEVRVVSKAEAPQSKLNRRMTNPDRELRIISKLKQAFAVIKEKLPNRRTDRTSDTMAMMVVGSRDGSVRGNGYSFEVIKKMIDGTYEPANRRGFQDPWGPTPA
jgi:hypothetical protein